MTAGNISSGVTASHIVQRDGSGYVFGNFFNATDGDTGGVTRFVVKNGDNFYRSATAATVQAALGLGSMAYQSSGSYLGNTAGSGLSVSFAGSGGPNMFSSGGGAAMMSFHRPGIFAVNFGLDTDNVIRAGGWSMGAASYDVLLGDNHNNVGTVNFSGDLELNSKTAIRSNDTWLRLNQDGDFTTGVHTPGFLNADSITAGAIYSSPGAGFIQATGNVIANNYLIQGNWPVGGGTTLCQGGFGTISICVSSIRYKTNVQDAPWTLDTIRQMRPVTYQRTDNGELSLGFIAEEMAQIDNRFGVYVDGTLEGVHYEILTSVLAAGIKQLDVQVQANDTRLDVVEAGQFAGNLSVAGNAQINGNLKVLGTTRLASLKVTGLTEVANLKVNGKIITAGITPTAVLGATTTGQGSTYTIEGNDTAGTISITTGTNTILNPLAAGEQATVTFNVPSTTTPRVTLTALTETSATLDYYVTRDVNGFKLHFVTPPAASTNYSFDYQIIQ